MVLNFIKAFFCMYLYKVSLLVKVVNILIKFSLLNQLCIS